MKDVMMWCSDKDEPDGSGVFRGGGLAPAPPLSIDPNFFMMVFLAVLLIFFF